MSALMLLIAGNKAVIKLQMTWSWVIAACMKLAATSVSTKHKISCLLYADSKGSGQLTRFLTRYCEATKPLFVFKCYCVFLSLCFSDYVV